jgi:hypothetical protein
MTNPQREILSSIYTTPLAAWQPRLDTLSQTLARGNPPWRELDAIYEQPPAPPAEFVTSDLYLGLGNRVYPVVLRTLEEVFSGAYSEAALCWGIGSGKSFFSSLALSYLVHRTLCLRDPQGYYGLAPGSAIAFLNMSASAGQAQRVVFGEIKQRLTTSPWFRRFCNEDRFGKHALQIMAEEIRLPKHLVIVTGNSAETCPLGYNLLGAVLDEAAFLLTTGDGRRDAAEEIYHALRQRITSRFFHRGLLVLISSPRHVGDFIERKLAEAADPYPPDPNLSPALAGESVRREAADERGSASGAAPNTTSSDPPPSQGGGQGGGFGAGSRPSGRPRLYTSRRALWEVKPPHLYCGQFFEYEGMQIPIEYQDDFRRNPQRALRDLAARPTQAYCAWFTDPSALEACCSVPRGAEVHSDAQGFQPASDSGVAQASKPASGGDDDPLDSAGRWRTDLRAPDRLPRFVHVDLGLRRDGCGLAMVHCRPSPDRPEEPDVWADVVVRLTAGQGGGPLDPPPYQGGGQGGGFSLGTRDSGLATSEIDFSRVRELINDLRRRGYHITQVSFDGWQSVDSRQILRRQGFRTALVSVDRDLGPYETLKELINTGRLHFPRYAPLLRELSRLELVAGRKVDHPRGGSKDCADALAAATSEALKAYGGGKVGGRIV